MFVLIKFLVVFQTYFNTRYLTIFLFISRISPHGLYGTISIGPNWYVKNGWRSISCIDIRFVGEGSNNLDNKSWQSN